MKKVINLISIYIVYYNKKVLIYYLYNKIYYNIK